MPSPRQGVPILHDMVAGIRGDRDVDGASEGFGDSQRLSTKSTVSSPVGRDPEVRKDNTPRFTVLVPELKMPSRWDCFLRVLKVGMPLLSLLYFVAITMRFFDVIPAWMLHAWIVTVAILMSQLSFFLLDVRMANALAKYLPRTSVVILPLGILSYVVLWFAIFLSQGQADKESSL